MQIHTTLLINRNCLTIWWKKRKTKKKKMQKEGRNDGGGSDGTRGGAGWAGTCQSRTSARSKSPVCEMTVLPSMALDPKTRVNGTAPTIKSGTQFFTLSSIYPLFLSLCPAITVDSLSISLQDSTGRQRSRAAAESAIALRFPSPLKSPSLLTSSRMPRLARWICRRRLGCDWGGRVELVGLVTEDSDRMIGLPRGFRISVVVELWCLILWVLEGCYGELGCSRADR